MIVQANGTYYKELNEKVRSIRAKQVEINGVVGQRYIGCGSSGRHIKIHGTPGNGLGQYLNGSTLEVFGNAQEAVGDTMNDGDIIIHGNCGDAAGYGMRGGRIFVEKDCGYRGGIHMKAYESKYPTLIVGGKCGSFLGEYQAGGLILVLGIGTDGTPPVGYFTGTGMHGGKIVLHCTQAPSGLPRQVLIREASKDDLKEIAPYIKDYCKFFSADEKKLTTQKYFVLTPNPEAGYKQLYTYEV